MTISRGLQPRQQYGLGSFVKKITKGAKNIVKSPLGKAALLGLGAYGLSASGGFKSLLGNFSSQLGPQVTKGKGLLGLIGKGKNFIANMGLGGKTLGMFGLGALGSKLFSGPQQQMGGERDVSALRNYLTEGYRNLAYDEKEIPELVEKNLLAAGGRVEYADGTEDPDDLYSKSYVRVIELMDEGYDFGSAVKKYMEETRDKKAMGGRIGYSDGTEFEKYLKGREEFDKKRNAEELYKEFLENKRRQKVAEQKTMAANGGRIGYAFGNKPEQNAIQAAGIEGLPLNQNPAGVTELDLRDSGGFIPPVGVKEKADDIPAMLANNEFVFTADAVRGMGEGNVNKGAQRMYDMMKKLEKGGRV